MAADGNSTAIQQTYSKTLEVSRAYLGESDSDVHDFIVRGLAGLEPVDYDYIFNIPHPSEIMAEGEKLNDEIIVEDFAIIGSERGNRMAIGQVVSCRDKGYVGSVPRDQLQINGFGEEIRRHPDMSPEITGYYLVRTPYSQQEIRNRNKYSRRDIGFFGKTEIPVEIQRVEPDERDIEEAMRNFYSSLTQS